MKKTMLFLCTIMVSTGMIMTGCKKETPTDVVNTYFSTLKKSSTSEAEKLIENTILKDAINTNTSDSEDSSKTSKQATSDKTKDSKSAKSSDEKMDKSLQMYLSKVDAKVLSEKVSADKATVKVKVKAPNYSNLLLEVMEDSIASTLSGKDVSQAQVEKNLQSKIKSSKSEARTGEINLVKKDSKWTIKSDDDITNLLLGEADETESIMYSK